MVFLARSRGPLSMLRVENTAWVLEFARHTSDQDMHPSASAAHLWGGNTLARMYELGQTPDHQVIAVPPFASKASPGVGKILDSGPAVRLGPILDAGLIERRECRQSCGRRHESGANLGMYVHELPECSHQGSPGCGDSRYDNHAQIRYVLASCVRQPLPPRRG